MKIETQSCQYCKFSFYLTEGLQHWVVEQQGGDAFAVEPSPSGHNDNIRDELEDDEGSWKGDFLAIASDTAW